MTNQTKWSIDQSHSEITFNVRHLMIANIKGNFKKFDASIYTQAKEFDTAEVDFWIDSSSISTGDEKRDEHLRGSDFLDVENHKQISFVSNTIEKSDKDGNYELWGDLTIKGITKKIKLIAQLGGIINDPFGNEKAGFTVTGKINRVDWGLNWNSIIEGGGVLVSEEISIVCELELINVGQKELKIELVDETKSAFNGKGCL